MSYLELMKSIRSEAVKVFTECEIYISTNKSLTIEVFEGEISKYTIAESGGMSLRGMYKGKMGYAYTEKIDISSMDMLIEQARQNSEYLEESEEEIYGGCPKYEIIDVQKRQIKKYSNEEKIDFVLNLEKAGWDNDKIDKVMTSYTEISTERHLLNSKMLYLEDLDCMGVTSVSVVAKDGEEVKTGGSYRMFRNFDKLDYKEIAKEAIEDGVSQLGAKSIPSNNYPVVFKNTTFASLLNAFSSIFSADDVHKGLSLLKDKKGEKIASGLVTLVDDPYLENGMGSKAFDAEGTATIFHELIKDGVLTSYLYDWKTAKKDGTRSTGNAVRSYKSSIEIAPTNMYIVNGDMTAEELLQEADNGVYIDSLQGLHSGLNPVSGDFSLSASGYKIEEGKKSSPVNQITVAGNLFELLNNIIGIGSDLEFDLGSSGKIGSPSIFVNELSISGE